MKRAPGAGDTIAAVATARGASGIGIVRISGPRAGSIARSLLGALPPPRCALRAAFADADGEPIDDGIVLWFPAPRSFTGEDVLELHGHGGPVVLDLVLARIVELGARIAQAGEFSERAFLNGKIDLAQAEAVADLIEAQSSQAARAARRTLAGALSSAVRAVVDDLVALRSLVEATLDFPDEEDVAGIGREALASRLAGLLGAIGEIERGAEQGRLLRDGIAIAIIGRPNVGKSSLLNRLCGYDAAIVTPHAGTTRDVLRERVSLAGLPVLLLDTAGLRETVDEVEALGVERASAAAREADLVVHVVEDAPGWATEDQSIAESLPFAQPRLVVRNKIDLTGRAPGLAADRSIGLCAIEGQGVDALVAAVHQAAGAFELTEGAFTARRRHLEALAEASAAIVRCEAAATGGLELLAEELRLAQRALGRITGEVTTEDLLGAIFSSFCIGK